jgi:hypothetical protein
MKLYIYIIVIKIHYGGILETNIFKSMSCFYIWNKIASKSDIYCEIKSINWSNDQLTHYRIRLSNGKKKN